MNIIAKNLKIDYFIFSLKKQFETIVNLWTSKQRKLRQNMIFATIKIIKSWDITKVRYFYILV